MAPEFPPSLVIFDARFKGNVLQGALEYVEAVGARSEHRLRVRWSVEDQPQDYRAVGGGVAYIYDKGPEFQPMPISENAKPIFFGDSRYQWTEGLQFGLPWLMFILILPKDYTLMDPWPKPVGTKIFRERLAFYWTLKGDDDVGHTRVECTIKKFQGDLESELMRINRDYLSSKAPIPSTISVEDTTAHNEGKTSANRTPWISGSFFLAAFAVIMVLLVVAANNTSRWALPLIIIGALLILSVVGAFQLMQDKRLSQKNFLELMLLTFQRLPLLTKGKGKSKDKPDDMTGRRDR
jgi:hypothetical protein